MAKDLQYAVDAVFFGMVLVVGPLVIYVKGNDYAAGHANGQAGDINKAVEFLFLQVA